jgi:UDP-glucose 4-epimerase
MNQLLRGEPMSIFGDGTQIRAFTHINDVAPIIAASGDCPDARNEIFNVGADESHTVNRLAQIVAAALEKECRTVHLDERKEVKIAFSDHSKVERFFGWKEKTSLESGVRSMAEWVRTYGARESSTFENIEINRNLPSSWRRISKVDV